MDKKTKEGVRHDLIIVVLWFTAMPAMMVAGIWLMGFVPTYVGDWFIYLPMRLAEYLAFPGFILGVLIMLLPISAIIGLINVSWRRLFRKNNF